MQKIETRPWGTYEILLDEFSCKVKKITINPQQRTSLQLHNHRMEYWTIIQGEALATVDNENIVRGSGTTVHVPLKAKHRIQNTSMTEKLTFIEVQLGTYFGEDDIERFSDDYNRV